MEKCLHSLWHPLKVDQSLGKGLLFMDKPIQLMCGWLSSLGILQLTRYLLQRLFKVQIQRYQFFLIFLWLLLNQSSYHLDRKFLITFRFIRYLSWFFPKSFYQNKNLAGSGSQAWRKLFILILLVSGYD